jgi:hypothetical protein
MALGGVEGDAWFAAGALVALVVLRNGRDVLRHSMLSLVTEKTIALRASFPGATF